MAPERSVWRPTPSLLAAVTIGGGLLILAVVVQRADLLVLALPLVATAAWAMCCRPSGHPAVRTYVEGSTPFEGESLSWRATLHGAEGAEQWAAVVEPSFGVVWDGGRRGFARMLPAGQDRDEAGLVVASERWGTVGTGLTRVVATSAWSGYVWGPHVKDGHAWRALPLTDGLTGRGSLPHPDGLVGPDRGRRPGEGVEFADIRAFRPGDRLRSIHWPVSTRTGELHVRVSHAEQDTEVVLVLDSTVLVADPDGGPDSLDRGVRACASLGDWFLARGERVGLEIAGAAGRHLPPSPGRRQQRRLLDVLSTVAPARPGDRAGARLRLRARPGALVLLVSPLRGTLAEALAAEAARTGGTVLVLDCEPPAARREPAPGTDELAWRIHRLERTALVDDLARHGIPVAAWAGPGSLDPVLRMLVRRPPMRQGPR